MSANTSQQLLRFEANFNHAFRVLLEFLALLHVIMHVPHRLVVGRHVRGLPLSGNTFDRPRTIVEPIRLRKLSRSSASLRGNPAASPNVSTRSGNGALASPDSILVVQVGQETQNQVPARGTIGTRIEV